jgi:hypothetical protein
MRARGHLAGAMLPLDLGRPTPHAQALFEPLQSVD